MDNVDNLGENFFMVNPESLRMSNNVEGLAIFIGKVKYVMLIELYTKKSTCSYTRKCV